MKKIFNLVLVLLFSVMLFSCSNATSSVKLASINCYANDKVVKRENDIAEETESNIAIDYQYLIVDSNDKFIDMKIVLDNPNDYHIFDISLNCNNNSKILLNGNYELISEQNSITWQGDTNSVFIIHLELEDTLENTDLQITSIYFTDRQDCSNKLSVDLNNKSDYSIYKKPEIVGKMNYDFTTKKYFLNCNINDERIICDYNFNADNYYDEDSCTIDYQVKYTEDLIKDYSQTFKFSVYDYIKVRFEGNKFYITNEWGTTKYRVSFYNGKELKGGGVIENGVGEFYQEITHIVVEYYPFEDLIFYLE